MKQLLDDLKECGFEKAAADLDAKASLRRRLMLAYENHKVLTPECLEAFQVALRKKSEEIFRDGKKVKDIDRKKFQTVKYDRVRFRAIAEYPKVPPADVLEKVKASKETGIFDAYEIADVESVQERVDPIVFGRIEGCPDRFFIAQWDNDLKFEDMVKDLSY